MKEFEAVKRIFGKGIRPKDLYNDSEYLDICKGLVANEEGLRSWANYPTLFGTSASQLLSLDGGFIIGGTSIGVLDKDLITQSTIVGNNSFYSLADFKSFSVLNTPDQSWVISDGIITATNLVPLCNGVCYFKGRMIGVGVLDGWNECNESSFFWSNIRQLNFEPDLRNESGWLHTTDNRLLLPKPIGERVVLYGTERIDVTQPAVKGFGSDTIFSFGIPHPFVVCGDHRAHWFISNDGCLWKYNANGEYVKRGFEWLFKPQINILQMSFDSLLGYVLITNGTSTYVATDTGLTEIAQVVYGVDANKSICIGTAGDNNLEIETGMVQLNQNSLRTIRAAELRGEFGTNNNLSLVVKFRYKRGEALRTSKAFRLQPEGMVTPVITASEFKFNITGTTTNRMHLDSLALRFSTSDYRAIRGASNVDAVA